MHLQSLELFGFKSFADKTIFNFHEGITAIVGPNGCGKSNVLDATRWVLGEQSAKSLRGGEMADVIFNGTDNRKPLGFAEVSLTLTDCAGELGVEWHDVRVTRRVYRDGNSEYFLNKTPCRLRDIQSLFADTGVARSAYSMMEQGKIDLILSSRPEDRRAVFEEAAGITKYKTQKREALRKLEATEANLLRVGDIIKEVKRQIGSLQRQAGKARRYQALLGDLQVLETHHSRKRLETLESELAHCRSEIKQIAEKESSIRQKIDERESELAESRHALDEMDEEIAQGRAEIERLQSEINAHRSRIEFNRQRADEIAELIARAEHEIAAAETKREQHQSAMQEVNTLVENTERLLQEKRAELERLTELSGKLRADRTAGESELRELQATRAKAEGRVSALEDEITGISIRREATAEHLRELDAAISQGGTGREKAEAALAAAQLATEGERKNVDALHEHVKTAETAFQQARRRVAESEASLTSIDRSLAEKESRLEVLKQLNEEGEGLGHGSQAVLKGLDDPARIRPALAGALVSQLDVDPKFVPAIEAALGRNLHALILQDASLAREILATVAKKKLGQTALFVPGLGDNAGPAANPALPNKAIAFALDKVAAPQALEDLVRMLLGDVVIFGDLADAIEFKKTEPQFSIATLAGEFISRHGIIFGGGKTGQNESLLERKARITTLLADLTVIQGEQQGLKQIRDEAISGLEKAEQELEAARAHHRAADLAQSALVTTVATAQRDVDEAARAVDRLLSEKATLTQQIEAAETRLSELKNDLNHAREELAQQQQQLDEIEKGRQSAVLEEEKIATQVSDLRLAIATEHQRHESLVAQREPMMTREAELLDMIESRHADISTYKSRLTAQADESSSAGAAIERENARREDRKAALDLLLQKRTGAVDILNEAEAELREVRDSINELHDRRAAQQVRESQLQMKIENLTDHVQRRYHVDLRAFVPDDAAFEKTLNAQLKKGGSSAPSLDANNGGEAASISSSPAERPIHLEQFIAEMTRRLDDMGPVNLEAVQEYDELEERYKFLDGQNNDLTTSRRELLDVIARINSTTQKLFAETFAQVRVNFREMFAELFGGGRADLSLMDESDPLNCGIEISAKPPGKQLQTISLLSGGERTMTAVALLFAIYMVRPSPFCVLDEMDAALDETNINRFIRVLERFVGQSQFIIITHNKRTIAKADVLYGVTMEERGVSKLVGMRLADRPEAVADRPPESMAGHTAQRHFPLEENGHSEQPQRLVTTR